MTRLRAFAAVFLAASILSAGVATAAPADRVLPSDASSALLTDSEVAKILPSLPKTQYMDMQGMSSPDLIHLVKRNYVPSGPIGEIKTGIITAPASADASADLETTIKLETAGGLTRIVKKTPTTIILKGQTWADKEITVYYTRDGLTGIGACSGPARVPALTKCASRLAKAQWRKADAAIPSQLP